MDKIYLWQDAGIRTGTDRPSIVPMLLDTPAAPAVLVIPGGGYGIVCSSTEGCPIGKKFNQLGYHAFVLDYRTAPARFPEPQLDAMRAMKIIRANAQKWNVIPDQIYSCGFSAGAHLAGSLGILCDGLDASDNDFCDEFSHRPDGMILCYGVLAFEEWSHNGTQQNLLGEDFRSIRQNYSLPELVDRNTPPAFLMHTICDQAVSYRNSLVFADAMAKKERPCKLVLNYWGDHGMLLGKNTLDAINWPEQADAFFKSVLLSERDPEFRSRYTHAYQSKHVME